MQVGPVGPPCMPATHAAATTRVKRSAFYCVEEGVLRSGKKRNFYSCISATSGAQGV